jgi:hypothetical protein
MKIKILTLSAIMLFALSVGAQERYLLSNVGLSLNGGLTGVGATLSTPLSKHFTLRAGFGTLPYSYKYTIDNLELGAEVESQIKENIHEEYPELPLSDIRLPEISHEVDLKAKLNVPAAHVLVDYNPFKGGLGAFHLTAGIFTGNSNLAHVNGNTNRDRLQTKLDQISDDLYAEYPLIPGGLLDIDVNEVSLAIAEEGVHLNDDGTADAYLKVNSVRPYFGIGWGNAIPKRRVGFRFDIGAMYQGKPRLDSPNYTGDLNSELADDTFNKILDNAKFWPQLSFQLTFRLLKDK